MDGYCPLFIVSVSNRISGTSVDETGNWAWQEQLDNKHRDPIVKLPLKTFTSFGLLPTEIRLKIWNHTRPDPRIVRLAWSKKAPEAPSWTGHPEHYQRNYSITDSRHASCLHRVSPGCVAMVSACTYAVSWKAAGLL